MRCFLHILLEGSFRCLAEEVVRCGCGEGGVYMLVLEGLCAVVVKEMGFWGSAGDAKLQGPWVVSV